MSYYGKLHNKSTITTRKDYTKLEGLGSARSNDRDIAITISEGLADSVSRANQIAYEAHKRSMGWK
ncbi:MAG: hypothetical protein GTN40_05490 [Candidatus Aenigmarchaeota archaeon]|nr:hypothetical protein [Candidatus Aenigmarchaeota archaeon]